MLIYTIIYGLNCLCILVLCEVTITTSAHRTAIWTADQPGTSTGLSSVAMSLTTNCRTGHLVPLDKRTWPWGRSSVQLGTGSSQKTQRRAISAGASVSGVCRVAVGVAKWSPCWTETTINIMVPPAKDMAVIIMTIEWLVRDLMPRILCLVSFHPQETLMGVGHFRILITTEWA